MKTGSSDFMNNANTNSVSVNDISSGTNVLHTSVGEKTPHHVSVIAGITIDNKKQVKEYSFYQGNFRGGLLYDRLLGSANPDDWNYYGSPVQEGEFNLSSDKRVNSSLNRVTANYTSDQKLAYRNFNFISMNVKYKYKLVQSTITDSSSTTNAPTTISVSEYKRDGIERRKP